MFDVMILRYYSEKNILNRKAEFNLEYLTWNKLCSFPPPHPLKKKKEKF